MASGSNGPLNNWLRAFFAGTLATFAVSSKEHHLALNLDLTPRTFLRLHLANAPKILMAINLHRKKHIL